MTYTEDDELEADSEDMEDGRCLRCGRTLAFCACVDGDETEDFR